MDKLQVARGTIRLIAFDLDGTVLNSQKQVTARTQEAMRQAVLRGIRLVPATGRLMNEIFDDILSSIPQISYIVAGNGARVYRMPGQEVVFSREFTQDVSRRIIEECRRYKAMVHVGYGESGVLDNRGPAWEHSHMRDKLKAIGREWKLDFSDTLVEMASWKNPPCKLTLNFFDIAERERAFTRFSQWPQLSLSSSEPTNMEIMPTQTSKGSALTFLAECEGLEPRQVMAIGDNHNDMDMLSCAGLGVAMDNAEPEIREMADAITASCDEDGVALAIEAIL